MKHIVGQLSFLLIFLCLAPLGLAGCGSGGDVPDETEPPVKPQVCSASVVTRDGKQVELQAIGRQSFLLAPIIPSTFGAGSVELNLAAIERATLAQGSDLHEIQLRDGITLSGYLSGSLDGSDQHIEWKNIREATITCYPAQVEYTPPQGVEAVFYDEGGGSLTVYGLRVLQSSCTPSGEPVNGYQLCIEGSVTENVLRVNATQDGKVYIEYEIPLEYLTSMSWSDGIQYLSPMLGAQTLRGEFHSSWASRPEGSMMLFEGENAAGTWRIVPSGDFRVDFKQAAAPELTGEAAEAVGSCTTIEGETLEVWTAEVEVIPLRIDDNVEEIPWADIRQVKLFSENSWLSSDDYQSLKFWQPVEVTLVDGQVLLGEAYLEEGFITTVRPDGVGMNIPLYGLMEISMGR